ncbi:alpha/beta fold hydrolase [Nocardioides sp. WG-D5]|uniref:alpha/beta fold hydrolase n=1 Tax=Nocardioides luteus TaxID=1844 RepID=UPI00020289A2|nr:alpha/beta hydrolase [Nocardioides luteus]EGD44086.1 secreted protein [Nocardioidaceae bacterium Broad-1]MBG6095792.1 pimeloyl-ACP methyl ester carboxylesterase [Nocardioides luteus]
MSNANPTVILVHGAFVDGSGWQPVHDLLTDDGLDVAVTQHSTRSLTEDVTEVHQIIEAQDGLVLLVGHSYGGVVITEAGTHPQVAGLVYVAAFAPDAGESVASMLAEPDPDAPAPPIVPRKDGSLVLERDRFQDAFAADLPPGLARFMADSQTPWGGAALSTAVTEPAWRSKPSWYVVATGDRMIPPSAQEGMAARAGASVEKVAASHSVFISQPEAVADLIKRAAKAIAS